MGGAVPPLPQYALLAWCSVGGAQGNGLVKTDPVSLILYLNEAQSL